MIELYNGDCIKVIDGLIENNVKVDAVLTSPPYNVSRKTGDMYSTKYGVYQDTMANEDYILWQTELFNKIDKILNENGVIIYNINYGGENTDTLWLLLASIIQNTPFTIVDQIAWKKNNAIPNNVSGRALTRIVENVFIFSRKKETKTFMSNKQVISISKIGQKIYENVFNFIEAPNNDQGEHTKIHKATYSIELCTKLLKMYVPENKTVLEPFMGSGTTGIACKQLNRSFIGIELDKDYFNIAKDRIDNADVIETSEENFEEW